MWVRSCILWLLYTLNNRSIFKGMIRNLIYEETSVTPKVNGSFSWGFAKVYKLSTYNGAIFDRINDTDSTRTYAGHRLDIDMPDSLEPISECATSLHIQSHCSDTVPLTTILFIAISKLTVMFIYVCISIMFLQNCPSLYVHLTMMI